MKGENSLYYVAGNDNNGAQSKNKSDKQRSATISAIPRAPNSSLPAQTPLVPPANNMLGFFVIGSDKPGKDTNFRGLTIFDNTLYVSKGSGGNGVNTVYQVGTAGSLPTTSNAPGTPDITLNFSITPLPGLPSITRHSRHGNSRRRLSLRDVVGQLQHPIRLRRGRPIYTPNQVING